MKIKFEYKITIGYLLIGGLWILFSDKILYYFIKDSNVLTHIQTYKGWFYVLLTGALFFIFLKKHLERIRKAENEAKESDRLKTSFLQNISHEIRTPMNGIIGFANLLGYESLSDDQRKEYIKVITKSSNQLLSVVNDVLDISMIQSGNIQVAHDLVDINELLEEIYSIFRSRINQNVKFILAKGLSGKSAIVTTDVAKIRQILFNLLSNAQKFTEEGYIEFGYYKQNNNLKFYVEDSGIGIKKELHGKIFDRFQKAENNVMKLYDGVGLGLAICKGNIDLLGGDIGVESDEGRGSRFYFSIPYITSSETKDIKDIGKETKPKVKNESVILIAEDDQANVNYVKEILKRAGINFVFAENGQQAVDICRRQKNIILVLMDLKMPVMDGYQATKEIKDFRSDLPIIAQTAFAFENEKLKILSSGFDSYIAKPFKKEELLRIINEYKRFN